MGYPIKLNNNGNYRGGGGGGGYDEYLLEWKFQGVGVLGKVPSVGRGYRYFLELHNMR